MSASVQHKISRVRKPRVQITYDVEIGDAIEKRELPFVVGVISDLSGDRDVELPPLRDRKFIEIDRDNLMDIMYTIHPRLTMKVVDKINHSVSEDGEESTVSLELRFRNLEDFEPQNLAKNAACLSDIFSVRNKLRDVLVKLDGNDMLEKLLTDVMNNKEIRDQLKKEIDEYKQSSGSDNSDTSNDTSDVSA